MFCLSGTGSVITCDFFPSLDLSQGEWEIGLIDLTTYNSIPNIEEGVNDMFYYGDSAIRIPTGSYEIDDLENYIKKSIGDGVTLSLKPNNNTLKTEIKCTESIHFEKPRSICKLLGFESRVYEANKTHVSEMEVNIIKVNVVRVECNIVRGSYDNGRESHVIHEFYPSVGPGFKIIEIPSTVIYLPVNVQRVSSITVKLKDQNGDLVNLREETLSLRLHLRRSNGVSI